MNTHDSGEETPIPRRPWHRLKKNTRAWLFLAITAVSIFLRLYHLEADPPHWSYAYNTDEGHYSYNSQNMVRLGRFFDDDGRYGLITPVFTGLQWMTAAVLVGCPSEARLRAISALAGLVTALLLGFFFRPRSLRFAAWALGGFLYMGICHARLGIPEMLLTCWVTGTVLLAWRAYEQASWRLAALAGVAAGACVLTKPTGVMVLPVVLLAPLLCPFQPATWQRYYKGVFVGGGAIALIWLGVFVVPQWSHWMQMNLAASAYGRDNYPTDIGSLLGNISSFLMAPAFQTAPILWALSLSWMAYLVLRFRRLSMRASLIALWLCSGALLTAIPSYQPPRWLLILMPAIIISALDFIAAKPSRRQLAVASILGLILTAGSAKLFALEGYLWEKPVSIDTYVFRYILPCTLIFFIVLFGLACTPLYRRFTWPRLLIAVVAIELSIQLLLVGRVLGPSYHRPSQWENFSNLTESLSVSQDTVFSGDCAQDLYFRADIRVLPSWYLLQNHDDATIRTYFSMQDKRPTHFVWVDYTVHALKRSAPVFLSSLDLVAQDKLQLGGLWQRPTFLYKVRDYGWLESSGPPSESASPAAGAKEDRPVE